MATQMAEAAYTASDPDNYTGYRTFQTGGFGFRATSISPISPGPRAAT